VVDTDDYNDSGYDEDDNVMGKNIVSQHRTWNRQWQAKWSRRLFN
jgi:hypothetical protein